MVNMADAFPTKYLKAADLQDRQVRALMDRVEMETIGDGEDKKPVLYFSKSNLEAVRKKGLVLNKTNNKTICAAYGYDSEEWGGKEIVLFMAMVDFRGDTVEAIRVRMPKPQKAPEAPPPKAKNETENPGDGFDDVEDTF